ncbi:MAG: glucose-6-phosphate isomerase [Verrucomicrobiales bacterium]|nr:glucose-6-phosphate isomerase [Verrucomicrobiales bacterium]MDB6131108.1 glucose-6-phosphate isomerase [Verrucomicrobiales bacterium]
MNWTQEQLWDRFKKFYSFYPTLNLGLDISRVGFPDNFFDSMGGRIQKAFNDMQLVDQGAIANPDEKRMVGHYWLRAPKLAPNPEITRQIESTIQDIETFAGLVHSGAIKGAKGPFKKMLIIGIGGSALGPQFVAAALGNPATDRLSIHFFDNTDPDGIDKVLQTLNGSLGQTLSIVISKSGGTKETRNGMLEAEAAYKKQGLDFSKHAVAITGLQSELDKFAESRAWLRRFPMWDWVGGRTSVLSAVGLLPAALQGFPIRLILSGAAACDAVNRNKEIVQNPAAQLALMWHYVGAGRGSKDMVVLPYKDRLELFSKYLQQLVMESLGKELDLSGKVVNQGIAVYGNKGSTDQHAYVQQLREGVPNFFVVFIEVLKDRNEPSMEVEPNVTSGDFLHGFYLGTRQALFEKGRQSITLTIREVSPFSVGLLIALFERAVGIYASLINVNAYHQPGVEAGKKAATTVLSLQHRILDTLHKYKNRSFSAEQMAEALNAPTEKETIFKICEHLAANPDKKIEKLHQVSPVDASYQVIS